MKALRLELEGEPLSRSVGARRSFWSCSKGAVLAEFAVAFPVLITTYFCFLQMAQAYTAGLVLRHATVVTARYASVSLPSRFIPDRADHTGQGRGNGQGGNPAWEEVALAALGPWKNVARVKQVSVTIAGGGADPWADVQTKADYEYTCRVPVAKYIVCRGGVLTRTVRVTSPLQGATYVL